MYIVNKNKKINEFLSIIHDSKILSMINNLTRDEMLKNMKELQKFDWDNITIPEITEFKTINLNNLTLNELEILAIKINTIQKYKIKINKIEFNNSDKNNTFLKLYDEKNNLFLYTKSIPCRYCPFGWIHSDKYEFIDNCGCYNSCDNSQNL
jgi:hypothetical protein